jgi:putative endopeptidase
MTNDIRPQDDLFRAVNGEWLATNEIPEDKPRWGSFEILAEESQKAIHEMLTENNIKAKAPLSVALYQSFMDKEAIDKLGVSPIVPILEEVDSFQTWEDFSDWTVNKYKYYHCLPIALGIEHDFDNPEYNTLHISQSGISLPEKAYYFEEQHIPVRKNYIKSLQVLLDLVEKDTGIKSSAADLLKFEEQIAELHWDIVKRRSVELTHNPAKYADVVKVAPSFRLDEVVKINPETVVDVNMPDFLENIEKIWTPENLENWKNWAKCRIIRSFAGGLSQEYEDASFEISKLFSGVEKQPPRWKTAVNKVNNTVGDELGKVYVDKYFPDTSQKRMAELVENLLKAYEISIKASTWLSEETKEKALDKLSKFTPHIGYPQHWHNYDNLTFGDTGDDYIQNVLNIAEFITKKKHDKIGKPVDKLEWIINPQTVNAYYHPSDNVIVFPAAILQPPFFGADREDALNYGGIGVVIGHEVGHGFDDQGSEFDGDGVKRNWWTEEDRAKFKVLTDKLNAQFDKYTPLQLEKDDPKPHVNGGLTTGENVGDLSGLNISLLAYAISRGYTGKEAVDELVKSDPDAVKKFFEGYELVWCGKTKDEFARIMLAIDPHSPPEFRGNAIRNLGAFHDVYQTQPGDGMWVEPKDRINIW